MQNYIQQTGNAHQQNYQYIVIIRVRTQHVQVVLSTSTTLAQHCVRKVCLLALALALTSASLGASTFDGRTARGTSRWKCHPFHIPSAVATSQVPPKSGLGN